MQWPDGGCADNLSVFGAASFEVLTPVRIGWPSTAGRLAYVTHTYAGTVSVIDIESGAVVRTVSVGKEPNDVSVSP